MNLNQTSGLNSSVLIGAVAFGPLAANDIVDLLFHGSITTGAS